MAHIKKYKVSLINIQIKDRFYIKLSKDLKYALELGKEAGKILKTQSKNSYKK